MLVYIVVFLVIVYVVLDRSGILADLADTFRAQGGPGREGSPEPRELDPEANRRLEIFEDFIEKLEGDENDQEEE